MAKKPPRPFPKPRNMLGMPSGVGNETIFDYIVLGSDSGWHCLIVSDRILSWLREQDTRLWRKRLSERYDENKVDVDEELFLIIKLTYKS